MERFFTQHSVLRDRDSDELGGRVCSDSEASSESSCDEGEQRASERVHSVHDPTGPWRQTPVDGPWGQPAKRAGGRKARDFQSKYTGPKGVLNDYKAHKRSVRDERVRKEQERRDVLARIAKGVASIASATSSGGNAVTNQSECCDGDSDCECEALMDAAFLQKYQEQRLQELTEAAKRRKVYGTLEFISPEQFVELTNSADVHCVRFVHLFHPENYACSLLNTQLAAVAQQLPHVQFTALVAKDADDSIAVTDLPVLLIYRGAHLGETVIGVSSALDGEFTLARVLTFIRERLATLYGL